MTEREDRRNFESVYVLIENLLSCYNFALLLHENAHVFSWSEARNFVMYIIDLTPKSRNWFKRKCVAACEEN